MKLLLDTHTLIRALGLTRELPLSIHRLLGDGRNEIWYSAVSLFEIAMKRATGRPGAPPGTARRTYDLAELAGYRRLDVNAEHAILVETLAPFHPDPFDKLILAQAQAEKLRLVTADTTLAAYDRSVILF